MTAIHVARAGTGPEVLLVHGGASPATTWRGLERLAERFTLLAVHRRGFPPSPAGPQDFERDAADLEPCSKAARTSSRTPTVASARCSPARGILRACDR